MASDATSRQETAVIIEEGHTIIGSPASTPSSAPKRPSFFGRRKSSKMDDSDLKAGKRDSFTASSKSGATNRDSLDLSQSILRYLSFSTHPHKDGDVTEPNSPLDFSCCTVDDRMDDLCAKEGEDDLEMSIQGVLYAPADNVGRFRVTKAIPLPGQEHVEQPPPKTVIVLFGWLNCQDKHLFKYAQMYHKVGAPLVLRYTVPTLEIMRPFQRGVVKAVVEMLRKVPVQFPNSKVVVHYFSNGGCFCHWRLLQLLKSERFEFPQLAATIFDSAPATATALTGARAMSASTKNPFARLLVYSTIRFGLEAWGVMNLWYFERAYLKEIQSDTTTAPSLYIYSKSDHITDAGVVEDVIDRRRKFLEGQGLSPDNIQTWKLDESAHVCHYPNFPEEYKAKVHEFLVGLQLF